MTVWVVSFCLSERRFVNALQNTYVYGEKGGRKSLNLFTCGAEENGSPNTYLSFLPGAYQQCGNDASRTVADKVAVPERSVRDYYRKCCRMGPKKLMKAGL